MAIFRPIPAKASQSSVNDTLVRESLNDLEHTLRAQQFNNARATLSIIAGQLKLAVRSYNVEMLNTLTSVEEGIASGDLTLNGAKRELRDAFQKYRLAVEKVLDALIIPTQEDEARSLEDVLKRSTETLLSFEKNRTAIKERIKSQGVVVTTAPVLVLSAPGLDVAKLKYNGFKSKSVEGYPVIEEQMVVGISVDVVLNRIPGRKFDEKTSQPLKPSTPEQRQEVKAEFLETVLTRFKNRKLIQLGNEVAYEGTSWFWLAPSDHVKLFKSCTTSPHTVNSLSIKSWGFPFSSKG